MGQRGVFLLTFVVLVVFLSCSLKLAESRPQPRPQFGYGQQDGYLYKRQSGQDGESDGNAGLESDFDLDSDSDLDLSKRSFDAVPMGTRNRRKWWHYIPGAGQIAAKYHRAEGNEEEAEEASYRGGTILNSIKSKFRKIKDRVSEKLNPPSDDAETNNFK